jgi:hypothetical protein
MACDLKAVLKSAEPARQLLQQIGVTQRYEHILSMTCEWIKVGAAGTDCTPSVRNNADKCLSCMSEIEMQAALIFLLCGP